MMKLEEIENDTFVCARLLIAFFFRRREKKENRDRKFIDEMVRNCENQKGSFCFVISRLWQMHGLHYNWIEIDCS